jgi:hypothetical protein
VVQLDHEEVLIRSRIKVVLEIAPSFTGFLQKAMTDGFPVTEAICAYAVRYTSPLAEWSAPPGNTNR